MSFSGLIRNLFRARPPRVDIEKRFMRIARVGQGSMSKVWKARDLMSGRTVALKLLDKEKTAKLMDRDYGGAVRPTEGEISVSLKHPNLVATYEHGMSTQNEPFLVMEFIEGVGLNFLIETRDRKLAGQRIDFLAQAGEGLAYFHERGYIHRDICPRNMLVGTESAEPEGPPAIERNRQKGVVKLIDFGLAVPNTPEFRRPGNRTGTANYMAPELIKRDPTDERIDIFSFAVTAYECVVGRLPWDAADTMQMMIMHMNSPPRDPREFMPEIDNELAELLIHGLAQHPKKRVPSMKQFVERLRGLKRQDY
jgi:serine/threonine protein kinase